MSMGRAERARGFQPFVISGGAAELEAEYAADHWNADRLGIDAQRATKAANFASIHQHWLREPVKAWSRFRLATGRAWATISAGALAMGRFSTFLTECHPQVHDATGITRAVLMDYLSWLASSHWALKTRLQTLSMLRVFLDDCRRYDWLPGLPHSAVIYDEELPDRIEPLPRFVPEFLMAQLEDEDNLAKLHTPMVRNMIVLLIETGLRRGDLCMLEFNPIIKDSSGWPCLHFYNRKVKAEQLIPLSNRAVEAIRNQQTYDRQHWPGATRWLFPGLLNNHDGSKPYVSNVLGQQLSRWERAIDLRDEADVPVSVSCHRFRHTLGTRMINHGVPQHIVQKYLGHASPEMTNYYAHIHDTTMRAHFESYQKQRVNLAGDLVAFDPDAPTADAEWIKHNLARVRDSLPNGYCGRPPQQDCPHPNACLTCPDFQTTPEFLDIHRKQAATNRKLIARADANGQFRLASNLRQVQDNLERIIPALEALQASESPHDGQG